MVLRQTPFLKCPWKFGFEATRITFLTNKHMRVAGPEVWPLRLRGCMMGTPFIQRLITQPRSE